MNFIQTYGNANVQIDIHSYKKNRSLVVLDPLYVKIGNKHNYAEYTKDKTLTVGQYTVKEYETDIYIYSRNLDGIEDYDNPLRLIDKHKKTYYVHIRFTDGTDYGNNYILGHFSGKPPYLNTEIYLPLLTKKYKREILYYLDYIVGDVLMTPLQPWRAEKILKLILSYKGIGCANDIDDFAENYDLLVDYINS